MTTWSSTTLVRIADDYDREMGDTGARSTAGSAATSPSAWTTCGTRTAPTRPPSSCGPGTSAPGRSCPRLRPYPPRPRRRPPHSVAARRSPPGRDRDPRPARSARAERAPAVRRPRLGDRPVRVLRRPARTAGPEDESRPALLLAATLRLPADGWTLHRPAGKWPVEELLIDDAKQAVEVAVRNINADAGPRVAKLVGAEGGHW
ncbi:hypothetical protein NKH77_55850 [Streptomyces sp. M19]